MGDWLQQLQKVLAREDRAVLVSVADVQGSAPREAGAKLIVTEHGILGSIGGGNLEFLAIQESQRLARKPQGEQVRYLKRLPLGPSLGQCCGGNVTLAFEIIDDADKTWIDSALQAKENDESVAVVTEFGPLPMAKRIARRRTWETDLEGLASSLPNTDRIFAGRSLVRLFKDKNSGKTYLIEPMVDNFPSLWLFGAGHVGGALATVLEGLPLRLVWLDSRREIFPAKLPYNVTIQCPEAPALEVDKAPPGSLFLVMTHSHQLDLDICAAVLSCGDFRFLGLIGSATKKAHFIRRLRALGIPDATLARLVCPIGISGISGKQPKEIAVAVAAQLLQTLEARDADSARVQDLGIDVEFEA